MLGINIINITIEKKLHLIKKNSCDSGSNKKIFQANSTHLKGEKRLRFRHKKKPLELLLKAFDFLAYPFPVFTNLHACNVF